MFAYDMNGLQLSQVAETLNAYRLTAVDTTIKKYAAYARAKPRFKDDWSMFEIGSFKDPRDAAYVAQQFELKYTAADARTFVTDGIWSEIARQFREAIEIPEWQYPAEGLDFDDILGNQYKSNYVNNAREALVEAFQIANKKPPEIAKAKQMILQLETYVANKIGTYRMGAKEIVSNLK